MKQQHRQKNEAFLREHVCQALDLNDTEASSLERADSYLAAALRAEARRQACASAQAGVEAAEARRLAAEYDQEAARVRELLDTCCVPLEALSSRARQAARTSASACGALGLARPDISAAAAAWAHLLLRDADAAELEAQLDVRLAELHRQERAAAARLRQLGRVEAGIDAAQAAAEAAAARLDGRLDAATLRAKEAEYLSKAAAHAARVEARGVTPELHYAALAEGARELAALEARAARARAELAAFHGLPTSALAASVALQDLQRRLQHVQEQLDSGIAALG